jgi:hypothetical protein
MVSYFVLLTAISLSSALCQVAEASCLGSGCTCYEGMTRVDCDGGRATMIPDIVKMVTEELNFDHVLPGSLTYLDLVNNWPSLKKINFYTFSVYVCRWLDSVIVPDNVEIISQCRLETRKNGLVHTAVTRDGIKEQSMMTVKQNMRGLITSYVTTTASSGLNNGTNTTSELFTISMKFTNGELIVTVVIPICFVITASLIICAKWKLSNPSRITMDYKIRKPGNKVPKSPPPESAECLVDSY